MPGEPLLKGKVGDVGIGASCLVKPGMRAYTISTPTVAQGVSGFVLPGNHVDVLLTVTKANRDDGTGGGVTTTLLQNVEILAADQRLDSAETKADAKQTLKSVTLLVTPEMAAKLSLAQTAGTLHLSLRNDTDQSIAETDPVTIRELRFLQDAMPSELPAAKVAAGEEGAATVATTAKRVQPPLLIRSLRGNSSGLIYVTQN